jgi:CHASE3 domain sensor protein
MISYLRSCVRIATAAGLALLFAVNPNELFAQQHVVSALELQQKAMAASQARAQNLQALQQLLSSEKAQQAMRSAKMDPARVTNAVASLSDAELAQLASRANTAQADFAAGRLADRDLLLILVGIAALILIIVAVR